MKLNAHTLDIWVCPLLTLPALQNPDSLDPAETSRAARFYFEHHRQRFIASHVFLRRILAHYLQTPPKALCFTHNPHGKPALIESPLHFNLSHSQNLAVLAVTQAHPVGIDIEYFSTRDYDGIAKMMFSPQEYKGLKAIHPRLKPLSFFNIWAQKEAVIKACGLGLAYDTQSFNVPLLPHARYTLETTESYILQTFTPTLACMGAICFHPEITTVSFHHTTAAILEVNS